MHGLQLHKTGPKVLVELMGVHHEEWRVILPRVAQLLEGRTLLHITKEVTQPLQGIIAFILLTSI
jgi:hypothetical protein